VTWISPFQGPTAGGTAARLSGANFASGATVTFGGTAAAGVLPGSASALTATAPPHASGNADVKGTNPNGQSFTLKNGFRCENAPSCAYTVSPTAQAMAAAGGATSASVTVASGCSWSASSQVSWITITAGASGIGAGTVSYSVAANGNTTRTGT